MKNKIIGGSLIVLGTILGLYVGFWVMLIGGIMMIITQTAHIANGHTMQTSIVIIGIIKILFAGFCGSISALFLIIPGLNYFYK